MKPDLELLAMRDDLHMAAILGTIITAGGAITEAVLYRAMFAHGFDCDSSSALLSVLLKEGLVVRVGPVAISVSEAGERYVESFERSVRERML